MTEEIGLAMQTCAEDPSAGESTLHDLMSLDRERFVRASLPLLRTDRDGPGYQCLVKLLARSDQLMDHLCDPDCFSKEVAIELARQIVQFEPQLDTRLVQLLPGRNSTLSNTSNYATIERVLELLEVVSKSARIVPPLAHLMSDPNPRLRAKAALLIGRRVGNSRLAEGFLQQEDPRVRANAVESLWGDTASSAGSVLRLAAKDANNRVVGNALIGLYQLQDRSAVGQILAMSVDRSPLFRTTAAWAMGQTSDPRFLPALEKLARDLFASVRKNASKAIEGIRARTTTATRLELQVLRRRDTPGGRLSLSIQALGPEGDSMRALRPDQFILWEDQNLVMDYEVMEHANGGWLAVGFALCAGGDISGELLQSAEEAVLGCLTLKTKEHSWALAKFVSTGEQPPPGQTPPSDVRGESAIYMAEAGKLEKSIAKSPTETQFGGAALAAFRSLLPGALKMPGTRHLILLAASDFISSPEIEEQVDNAIVTKVTIHAIVVGTPHPSLINLCRRTEGILMIAADSTELAAAFRRLYLALMSQYEIRFRAQLPVNLQIYCEEGWGECRIGRE